MNEKIAVAAANVAIANANYITGKAIYVNGEAICCPSKVANSSAITGLLK